VTPPTYGSDLDPYADLPLRVIGKNLRLDPRVGFGYRGWLPASPGSVAISAQSYPLWTVALRAQIFKLLTIERAAFESSGLTAPGRPGVAVAVAASNAVPQAAALLGSFGVPLDFVVTPWVRYEQRAFATIARPSRPVVIVPHDTSPNVDPATLPRTTDPLRMVSAYETAVVGVKYDHDKLMSAVEDRPRSGLPSFYAGLGYTHYSRPYVLDVGGATLDDFLWDARFQGLGLALGLATPQRPGKLQVDLITQTGLGQIDLLSNYTLNQALPGDWLVGYVSGDLAVGFVQPIVRGPPSLLAAFSGTAGGAAFFAFKTRSEAGRDYEIPALNWDLLWSLRADLIVTL
jgi:hypothetical protein